MKRISCILLLFMFLTGVSVLSAQITTSDETVITIFDALQEPGLGKGSVIINQAPAIRNMVGAHMFGANVEKSGDEAFLKVQGFRTQVFSGNNQRKSKDEALQKEKEIKELFPDIPTYVEYDAPFWKVRVGDYRSQEEAFRTQRLLMSAFPTYAKEMYIVRAEVKIPLK